MHNNKSKLELQGVTEPHCLASLDTSDPDWMQLWVDWMVIQPTFYCHRDSLMRHTLQLQGLTMKTAGCSNTPSRQTLQASEGKESGEGWHAQAFTPSGHIWGQPLSNRDWAEFCWVVKSDTGQVDRRNVQQVLLHPVCFHQPFEHETNTSTLGGSDQTGPVAQRIEVKERLSQILRLVLILIWTLFNLLPAKKSI